MIRPSVAVLALAALSISFQGQAQTVAPKPGAQPASSVQAPASAPVLATDAPSRIRALLVPRNESALSVQIAAIIAEMPVRPGERFKKGDELVRFDCSMQKAEQQKAQAEAVGARKTLAVKRELVKLNSISQLEVALAEADAAKAEAQVALASAVIAQCLLKAPYDGRVVEVRARAHESTQPGQKLMEIVEESDPEIEAIVPSRWLEWLKPGAGFTIKIEETGKSYAAQVTKLGARVDAVSQSVKIYGGLKARAAELMPGMSGEAVFAKP
ncbi:MAG: efflux RND transporter periplasmic adaptor subunit [Alphaproteobacteria bacterium]|nr:efflux RND transporter periplasmic adaptor subunit [Alphaproteobacteria bacterium]